MGIYSKYNQDICAIILKSVYDLQDLQKNTLTCIHLDIHTHHPPKKLSHLQECHCPKLHLYDLQQFWYFQETLHFRYLRCNYIKYISHFSFIRINQWILELTIILAVGVTSFIRIIYISIEPNCFKSVIDRWVVRIRTRRRTSCK